MRKTELNFFFNNGFFFFLGNLANFFIGNYKSNGHVAFKFAGIVFKFSWITLTP